MNLNKAFVLGRVCSDIADKEIPSTQTRVAEFSVATNSVYGKGDKKTESVQYHNIVVYGKPAENCISFLEKGQLVFVEGRIQTKKWKNANQEMRVKTEIVAENVQFGPRSSGGNGSQIKGAYQETEDIPIIEDGDEVPTTGSRKPAPKAPEKDDDEIDVKDIPF